MGFTCTQLTRSQQLTVDLASPWVCTALTRLQDIQIKESINVNFLIIAHCSIIQFKFKRYKSRVITKAKELAKFRNTLLNSMLISHNMKVLHVMKTNK